MPNKKISLLWLLFAISFLSNILLLTLVFFRNGWKNETEQIMDVYGTSDVELLQAPWQFVGNKEIKEKSQSLDPNSLLNKDVLRITFDLHGVCLLNGEASAISIIAIDGQTHTVSLARYAKNCFDGEQYAAIPFRDFIKEDNLPQINVIKAQFWYPTFYSIDISSITAYQNVLGASNKRGNLRKNPKPTPTPTSKPTPSLTPAPPLSITPTPISTSSGTTHLSWPIQGVSSMKETKDRVCNQRSADFIKRWVDTAYELGVNYVGVETPYDNPTCGNSIAYTKTWVDTIHAKGLHVWHRHMPLAFEGIYNIAKDSLVDYQKIITDYIKNNPTFFSAGDIFTPIPEPQNGGILGVTYCPQNICMFSGRAHFNTWLRDAISISETAFSVIGMPGKIKIGYYGFDGFVTWGDNNPDWHGILEDATVEKMGNITIDHYPEIVGDTMANDLNELQAKYPNTLIIIGEWGTITGGNVEQQVLITMQAAKRKNVVGFNYWHMGVGGNEALIYEDFSKAIQFDEVQSFFKSTQ